MCVTLRSKFNHQGYVGCFQHLLIFSTSEMLESIPRSTVVSGLQPEIWKVMQKEDVWPWFSRSCNEYRICSLSPLVSSTPKTYLWEIFSEILRTGRQKFRGGVASTRPLGIFGWQKTLGVWWLIGECYIMTELKMATKIHKTNISSHGKIVVTLFAILHRLHQDSRFYLNRRYTVIKNL